MYWRTPFWVRLSALAVIGGGGLGAVETLFHISDLASNLLFLVLVILVILLIKSEIQHKRSL